MTTPAITEATTTRRADDQPSDYGRIVDEMGVPVAATVWSLVILVLVIAVVVWLVVKIVNRTGQSSDIDEHDDTPR